MFISQLVYIINTNYSRPSWCCFSSHFVVPRYPCELGCFDDYLFVDQQKNRLVAIIVVLLFEAPYTFQLMDTVTRTSAYVGLRFISLGL